MSEETVQNKKAAEDLARSQAMRGDKICGAWFALKDLARRATPGGNYLVETMYEYSDDEDDDIRPF